jgi:tellurite resistance protein
MENDLVRDARSLEDAFFLKEDLRLVESLREMKALEETTGLLAEVSGITDKAVLEHLARLKVTPAAAASLAILPLVEVAWADGTVDPAERQAVLASLDKALFFQTIDRDIVEAWLDHRPPKALVDAWDHYVKDLTAVLTAAEKKALAEGILAHARQVAQAAGTFLGLGGISKPEQAVLDRLSRAFA